jgi:hypothetical protein
MRAMTLSQVREVLSTAKAVDFLEAWARIDEETAADRELVNDLSSQSAVAEARVRLAEETARVETAAADEVRRQALAMGPGADCGPLLRRELEALASAHLQRAEDALDEAAERRSRSSSLRVQAAEAQARLDAAHRRKVALRLEAGALSGCVGESSLFFSDAERPGAAFMLPLNVLVLASATLQPFVLYRLPAGKPLEAAVPVRDVPPLRQGEPREEREERPIDRLTPRRERPRRAKESS